mgnify:CR=1 FL=1
MQMAGFGEWLKENALMASLPCVCFACMVVDADPKNFVIVMVAMFSILFVAISIVRFAKLLVEYLAGR